MTSRRGAKMRMKRGGRRAASERREEEQRGKQRRSRRSGGGGSGGNGSRFKHWLKRLLIWGGAAALLGALVLAIAVGVLAATDQIPMSRLKRRLGRVMRSGRPHFSSVRFQRSTTNSQSPT